MDEKEYLEEIKNNLTLDQIENLLSVLDGSPYRQNEIIISRTICHCGNSHKLFYYNNTKLFRCYTECSDTFDIFQLIMKVYNISLPQALNYIKNFFNIRDNNAFIQNNEINDWKILKKYDRINNKEKEKQIIDLKKFDNKILRNLPTPRIQCWEDEGISADVIKYHNICYNPISQAIVIPHYDMYNNLIGIRERTLIKENEKFGKYRPSIINKQMYNHPLGFNLYNLNNSYNHIKQLKKAIIFEGEKSPLLYASYFGKASDITVACCGSNLSNYQVELLLHLGVDEIIIAFDKQFKEKGDNEFIGWTKKLTEINNKYSSLVQISFMFDKNNLLEYKSSPIDEGKEKFLKLFKERIIL